MSRYELVSLGELVARRTERKGAKTACVFTASAQFGLVDQERFFGRVVAGADQTKYFIVEPGDFVYSKSYSSSAPMGAVLRNETGQMGVVSPLYVVFRPTSARVLPEYLTLAFHSQEFLNSLTGLVREGARAHGAVNISAQDFLQALIPVPATSVQRRIVDLLATADRVVVALAAESKAAESCREALVFDLLAGVSNRVPIGGLLTERTDTITVDDNVLYTQVTVAGKGRGMRLREQKLGRDIGTKKQTVLAADELVVSRIDARKGSACVVPGEFSGAIVTSSFPCFRIATAICVPEYLDLVVRSQEFARACDGISAGTTNRVAADMSRFGAILVPLPTVDSQRDIVGMVSTVDNRVAEAQRRLQNANTLRDQLLHDLLSGAHTIPESYDRFLTEVAS
jgi:type I restriction enzyme S subunit